MHMGLQESEMHPITIKLLGVFTAVQTYSWHSSYPVHFFPCDSELQLPELWPATGSSRLAVLSGSYLAHEFPQSSKSPNILGKIDDSLLQVKTRQKWIQSWTDWNPCPALPSYL